MVILRKKKIIIIINNIKIYAPHKILEILLTSYVYNKFFSIPSRLVRFAYAFACHKIFLALLTFF